MNRDALYAKLKTVPLLRKWNARLKSAKLRRDLVLLRDRYERLARESGTVYSEATALELMRSRRRGMTRWSPPDSGLRILWVGANWHQDSSGFLAGLAKFGEVVQFHNAAGTYGLRQRWDGEDVARNDRALREQFRAMRDTGPVHLVLGQMWAQLVSSDALQEIRTQGAMTANISMDDRLPEHWSTASGVRSGSVGLGPGLDMVLTSSPETPEWFLAEGVPAIYMPMASDPERFRPFPEDQKRYDVSFVGSKYGLREKLVNALVAGGIHVDPFGPGWPNGAVDATQSAEIFGRSRIILGMGTVAHSEDLFTIKLRDFDAPMCGAMYVTHRNPDLLQLYRESEEIACYRTADECVHKVRYYLSHPEHRRRVAAAGMARARADHTWQARLSHVFGLMGLS